MRMMLLAFVVIASLMSPLCDCAYTFQPPQGTPGFKCSAPGDCQPGLFTKIKHCCGGPPNGKYCSDCCVDTDCSGILPGSKFICTPLSFLFPSLYETHIRLCIPSGIYQSPQPCYRNDQCSSGQCTGGLGFSGDKVNLPLGKCAVKKP
jgi:hypothetical protein